MSVPPSAPAAATSVTSTVAAPYSGAALDQEPASALTSFFRPFAPPRTPIYRSSLQWIPVPAVLPEPLWDSTMGLDRAEERRLERLLRFRHRAGRPKLTDVEAADALVILRGERGMAARLLIAPRDVGLNVVRDGPGIAELLLTAALRAPIAAAYLAALLEMWAPAAAAAAGGGGGSVGLSGGVSSSAADCAGGSSSFFPFSSSSFSSGNAAKPCCSSFVGSGSCVANELQEVRGGGPSPVSRCTDAAAASASVGLPPPPPSLMIQSSRRYYDVEDSPTPVVEVVKALAERGEL
eukprot:GHVU01235201.1.p1 GENE.GHVU01235201.1~~GHVU01235201.1.p1  ORF type:complete len:306 (+),score=63.95 GHVU01235201.1:37-918(+)